jgi:GT2 family glycosyltransferase
LELEHRFKNFPEFISRAPTMNLCVRTKYAKKVKFDERLEVAQETDWGYRLTKLGKMRYIPNAIVWHYHRPSLKSYFIQQFKYGKYMPLIYLKKHKGRITGDHISTPSMFLQLFFFDLMLAFFILSIFFRILLLPSILLLVFVILLFFSEIFNITKNPREIITLFFIYFLRVIAWTIGITFGLPKIFEICLSD